MSDEPEIAFEDPKKLENEGKQHRASQISELNSNNGKLSPKKLRTLWCLLLSIGINQTLYMNVSSLLPNYAYDNYCITESQVGIILS